MTYSEKLEKIIDLLEILRNRQLQTDSIIRKMKAEIDAMSYQLDSYVNKS